MARRKRLTLTIALGVASMLALIIGLASSAGGQAGGGLSEGSKHRGCSEATLQGAYLFSARGDSPSDSPDPTLPIVVAGVRTFDGEGKLSQVNTVSMGGVITRQRPDTGTYTLDSNCIGTMTIAGVRNWDIYVAEDGSEGVGVSTNEGRITNQTFRKGSR